MHKTRFEPDPDSAKAARDFVRTCLSGATGLDLDMILLLTTELASNAILHTQLTFEVSVELSESCARVSVDDRNAVLPAYTPFDGTDPCGRGQPWSRRPRTGWGIEPTALGKRAWFEMCA